MKQRIRAYTERHSSESGAHPCGVRSLRRENVLSAESSVRRSALSSCSVALSLSASELSAMRFSVPVLMAQSNRHRLR